MTEHAPTLTARLSPAGGGALRFALYWLLGAVTIGAVVGGLMELVPRPSPLHTTLVAGQALWVLAWLAFVVYRGTRGGALELSGTTLAIRHFLFWRRYTLTGEVRALKFVTHSAGDTYFNGPALAARTTSGTQEITIACLSQDLHRRLGLGLDDVEVVAPDAVVDAAAFEALYRALVT